MTKQKIRRIRRLAIIAAACAAAAVARARGEELPQQPPGLTVQECISVLTGLNLLNFVGEVSPMQQPEQGAKHYKLGVLYITIATNIAALSPVQQGATRAQQSYDADLPQAKAGDADAAAERKRKVDANWQKITDAPCPVKPGRIKWADLHVGDGDNENPIPPSVLALIFPIIDK